MLNQLVLMGRLVANPVQRDNQNDATKSFTTFTLAFDNIGKDEASFIDCVAFNQTGTALVKYAEKGDRIAVVGAIRQRKYVAKDGTNRSVFEVVVDSVEFLQPKKESKPDEIPPFDDLPEEKPIEDTRNLEGTSEELPPLPKGWHYEDGKPVKDKPVKPSNKLNDGKKVTR